MSASPPKEPDVEQNAQSGEEQEHMDRDQEGTQGTGLDFEVKEQDRWLPIANGWCNFHSVPVFFCSGPKSGCLAPVSPDAQVGP
jgi:hypothetical protein